jgi:hypothetical protein
LRNADFLSQRADAARYPDRLLEARIPHCALWSEFSIG